MPILFNKPQYPFHWILHSNAMSLSVLGSWQTEDDGDKHDRLSHTFEVEIYISVFKTVVIVISAQIQAYRKKGPISYLFGGKYWKFKMFSWYQRKQPQCWALFVICRNEESNILSQDLLQIDSIAVSIFEDILVELTNTVSEAKIQITPQCKMGQAPSPLSSCRCDLTSWGFQLVSHYNNHEPRHDDGNVDKRNNNHDDD